MPKNSDFKEAGRGKPPGIVREFFEFLADNKKWWMLPILALLLIFGLLAVLATSGVAPWIYTVF
jgi:hypothetical protein